MLKLKHMKTRTKIILPLAVLFVGVMTVMVSKSATVGADTTTLNANSSLYSLLTAAGFLLIAVSAIVALFMIASGGDKK